MSSAKEVKLSTVSRSVVMTHIKLNDFLHMGGSLVDYKISPTDLKDDTYLTKIPEDDDAREKFIAVLNREFARVYISKLLGKATELIPWLAENGYHSIIQKMYEAADIEELCEDTGSEDLGNELLDHIAKHQSGSAVADWQLVLSGIIDQTNAYFDDPVSYA